MKAYVTFPALCFLGLSLTALLAAQTPGETAPQTANQTIPLWPHGTPEPPQTHDPERDLLAGKPAPPGRKHNAELTNVTVPTMTIYYPPAAVKANGAAAIVLPGGGYQFLNMLNAGTEPCEWLNSLGVVCLLVRYRVPEKGWYPENFAQLEDAQQAIRLARAHAEEWHIDPKRLGLMGFSAGAHLAIAIGAHPDDHHVEKTPAARDIPMNDGKPLDARANFLILCWPGLATVKPDELTLVPALKPNAFTPTTFLIQAENDPNAKDNAIVYYRALMDAKIPAELHYYATGAHAFGMYPKGVSQERWAELAANWLRFSKIIP